MILGKGKGGEKGRVNVRLKGQGKRYVTGERGRDGMGWSS